MEQPETRTLKNNNGGKANPYPFPHKFDRANYTDLYLTHRLTETDVLRDIMHLLESYRVDAAIIDAGGRRVQGPPGAKSEGMHIGKPPHLKTGNGVEKGWADIEATLAPDGRALFIEVKQPRCINQCGRVEHHEGEPSHEQLEFLRQKQARGALVMVAWSADDVEHYLKTELHRNRRAVLHGETRYVAISPGRADQKHVDRMRLGSYLHEFLIAHQTDAEGRVYYGRPITYAWIQQRFRGSKLRNLQRWMALLREGGYVAVQRCGHRGFIVRILNQKKWPKPQLPLFPDTQPVCKTSGKAEEVEVQRKAQSATSGGEQSATDGGDRGYVSILNK